LKAMPAFYASCAMTPCRHQDCNHRLEKNYQKHQGNDKL